METLKLVFTAILYIAGIVFFFSLIVGVIQTIIDSFTRRKAQKELSGIFNDIINECMNEAMKEALEEKEEKPKKSRKKAVKKEEE